MLSISQNVRLCLRLSVRVSVCSLLRYRLNVFLPPLPEVGCPKILEIRNPWGNIVERSGLRFEHFYSKNVLNHWAEEKNLWIFFFIFSLLRYRLNVFSPPLLKVGCPKVLEIWNSWRKLMERSGQIWILWLIMGVKLPRKKVRFSTYFALLAGFFWYWFFYPYRSRDALSPVCRILLWELVRIQCYGHHPEILRNILSNFEHFLSSWSLVKCEI